MRPKKCAYCKQVFIPARMGQKVCSPDCAKEVARHKREKMERAEDKKKRESLKTRSEWMKDAQTAFNAFIRERDKHQTCICCNRPLADSGVGGGFDCGHYRSVGSAPHLRFDERNAHGQTKQCNRWGSGRAVDYRIGLVRRIGIDAVEALEADQSEKKQTIDDLKEIIRTYRVKLKALQLKEEA